MSKKEETVEQKQAVESFDLTISCQTELAKNAMLNYMKTREFELERYLEAYRNQVEGGGEAIDPYVAVEEDGRITVETVATNKGTVLVDEEGSLTSVDYSDVMHGEMYGMTVRGSLTIFRKEEDGSADVKWGQAGSIDALLGALVEINKDAEKVSIDGISGEPEQPGTQMTIS